MFEMNKDREFEILGFTTQFYSWMAILWHDTGYNYCYNYLH